MSTTPEAQGSGAPTGAAPAAPAAPATTPAAAPTDGTAGNQPAAPTGQTAPAAPVVPEKYELKLPEGVTAIPDGFEARAKAAGFTAVQAQAALDGELAARAAVVKENETNFQAAVKSWGDALVADPEIGGAKLESSKALAARAIAEVAPPEMKTFLESTGFGNHPVVVKHFVQLGKMLEEGKFVQGKTTPVPTDLASRLYPPTK